MSVTAISQTSATSLPVTASPPTTFLNRCVQELDLTKADSFQKQSKLWTVASYATLVVFTLLAVGGFVATGILAPIYIPIASIAALVLLQPVMKLYERFQAIAAQAKFRADQIRAVERKYQNLSRDPTVLQLHLLRNLGISWLSIPGMAEAPAQIESLRPLIARCSYWQESMEDAVRQAGEKINAAAQLSAGGDYSDENRNKIYNLRLTAQSLELTAQRAKINAAFTHAVIQRPTIRASLEELGSTPQFSFEERLVSQAFGDPAYNVFFRFNNRAIAPISVEEIRVLDISQLSHRILDAAAAA